ncbi:MAG: HAD-IA family hydrolase [Jaaginema sp. PMC 1079.18]|nr:HAD-IA family hydrolase [Jaaginema sp. PMC 1080.18]MEC4850532.1 HAD-IA family hydrolase [Jaaginema sp. PMC 1079.18]MEC4865788.1 HAD-IA family hydrolase [Jaaginema sp. PMC 1078.18]
MLDAILFDLDGTLTNTDPLHFQTWQEALATVDMTIDRAFYDRHISGRVNPEIVKDILPQLPFEAGLAIAADKERRFREMGAKLQRLAGLAEILAWTAQNELKQAVVTNAPRQNAEFMLEALELQTTFAIVILAEDVVRGKPNPAPYLEALTRLEIAPQNAIAFEDSPSGVKSASNAGIYTIGITSTHDNAKLIESGAAWTIADFRESRLWDYLESLPCS